MLGLRLWTFPVIDNIHVSNHLRATEEWWQTAAQTLQCLCSRLFSSPARNADMHFFLPPPVSFLTVFLFSVSFCISSFFLAADVVDVSSQLQLEHPLIDNKI